MTTNKQFLQVLASLPVALLAVGCYYTWNEDYITHSDGDILLITIHDPANPSADAFSNQVLEGARIGVKDLRSIPKSKPPNLHPIVINLNSSGSGVSEASLGLRVSQEISRRPLLGIISGGNSLTDEPLVALCRHLQIPLLLAVATNDSLMKVDSDEKRVVFRMLPNNTREAQSIAKKAYEFRGLSGSKDKSLAIVYEDNAYGTFLYKNVYAALINDKRSVFTFLIDDSGTVHGIMPSLEKMKGQLEGIVYLGYARRATELLQDLAGYGLDLPVILSDGCFSLEPDLRTTASRLSEVYISFPVKPWEGDHDELFGFERYGYNAYLLLSQLSDSIGNGNHSLQEALSGVNLPDQLVKKRSQAITQYSFQASGEPSERLDVGGKDKTTQLEFLPVRVAQK